MKHFNQNQIQNNPMCFIDFSKASPEAIKQILNALNSEMDEAAAQKRLPILEKVFEQLGPSSKTMM